MKLLDEELLTTYGGAINLNSTFLNSIARVVSTILELGRTIGSSISRLRNKNYGYRI